MIVFVVSVATVLVVSALCSLTEAALYAVRLPYARQLAESGSVAGKLLVRFKGGMERPISAILIVNTVANTAGASVAGVQAELLFGKSQAALVWFTVSFTLAVLVFSEILPKVVGVVHNRPIARAFAVPLNLAIVGLTPIIWFVQRFSRVLQPREPILAAPEEEVHQMAMLSAEEGSILPIEAKLVKNVLRLNEVRARDIMTPRTVVFRLPAELTLREVAQQVKSWSQSRIPVHSGDDPEHCTGLVLTKDILGMLARDEFDATLQSIARPLYFVPEATPGHVLLKTFLQRETHLFGVVDEYGGLAGVVTLEDVLESLLGEEIVDEADISVDLQQVARLRLRQRHGEDFSEPTSDDADRRKE